MNRWVSISVTVAVICAMLEAALIWSSFWLLMGRVLILSLSVIPSFFASSNIIVPKTTCSTATPFRTKSSRTLVITVVFPTPGIPAMTALLADNLGCGFEELL